MWEHQFLDKTVAKFIAANPNNKGSFGYSADGDNQTEYTFTLSKTEESLRGLLGLMSRPIQSADGTQQQNRVLINTIMGFSVGKFHFDFEYDTLLDPSKNTLTPNDSSDLEKLGSASMAILSYPITSNLDGALRFEHLVNDPGKQSVGQLDSAGLALKYLVNDELQIKTEWIHYNAIGVDGNEWSDSRYIVALLAIL